MAKRANGEGTITKRKDGRYQATITLGYVDGKRLKKDLYGKTRKEVRDKLLAEQARIEQGLPVLGQRQTVAQFLAHWLETSAAQKVRPSTLVSYRTLVRLHIVPTLGAVSLAKLEPRQVQELLAAKLATGLSPRRVQMIRACLRVALNRAIRWGLVHRNAAALADSPAVSYPPVEALTQEQARLVLGAVRGDRLEALVTVALALGLRQGEALGLRWRDVDLDGRELRVANTLQRIDGGYQLLEPKTPKSRRSFVLPEVLAASLRAHRARQLEERLFWGPEWVGNEWDLVFTGERGRPLHYSTATHHFKHLLKRAGLETMRFHDLRHGCATLLLAQGVPLRTIMEILGHSQIALTANLYAHVTVSMKREAAALMDAALGGL